MKIIEILFPIFGIAFVGFLFIRVGWVSEQNIRGLTRFVFVAAVPSLLFSKLSVLDFQNNIDWRILIAYYSVTIFIFIVSAIGKKFIFDGDHKGQGVFGFGATFGNAVFVGIPLVTGIYGEDGLVPMLIIISIHAATLFFLATIVAEGRNGGNSSKIIAVFQSSIERIIKNPIIIGIIIGT